MNSRGLSEMKRGTLRVEPEEGGHTLGVGRERDGTTGKVVRKQRGGRFEEGGTDLFSFRSDSDKGNLHRHGSHRATFTPTEQPNQVRITKLSDPSYALTGFGGGVGEGAATYSSCSSVL